MNVKLKRKKKKRRKQEEWKMVMDQIGVEEEKKEEKSLGRVNAYVGGKRKKNDEE